ncbi:MAG TPA: hypothetical protein VGB85_27625, partial [Nannocystis sp.]
PIGEAKLRAAGVQDEAWFEDLTMIPERPEVFIMGRARGVEVFLSQSLGGVEVLRCRPRGRPSEIEPGGRWLAIEAWRQGERIDLAEARPHIAASLDAVAKGGVLASV